MTQRKKLMDWQRPINGKLYHVYGSLESAYEDIEYMRDNDFKDVKYTVGPNWIKVDYVDTRFVEEEL